MVEVDNELELISSQFKSPFSRVAVPSEMVIIPFKDLLFNATFVRLIYNIQIFILLILYFYVL